MKKILFIIMFVMTISLFANAEEKVPHIGYLYPAGGQQGTVFKLSVGGQFLNKANKVYITGDGVSAEVTKQTKAFTKIKKEQKELFKNIAIKVRDQRLAELENGISDSSFSSTYSTYVESLYNKMDEHNQKLSRFLLAHPLLSNFDSKSLKELAHISEMIYFPKGKIQRNQQISDILEIEVRILASAPPGRRELRIETPLGLTNPFIFNVGLLPEIKELEPNDTQANEPYAHKLELKQIKDLPKADLIKLPAILNGQIMPGDIDRFRFKAKTGEKLVIMAEARSLIPYLSDAVPGWFQAVITLYDANGKKLEYQDDYMFNPDPVLFYEITDSGEYEIEIRDSIYRGREDFVYRISIGELGFVRSIFPLGGQQGKTINISLNGWNLNQEKITLNTQKKIGLNTYENLKVKGQTLNSIAYYVDDLSSVKEKEEIKAQEIHIPTMIDGIISSRGDEDSFYFSGKKGVSISLEVFARRLGSSLDSIVYIKDKNGEIIAKNDDYVIKDGFLHKDITGLITHHADSYLVVTLPEDGPYKIVISDSKQHGGENFGYRLRISPVKPDYALRFSPSSINVRPGGVMPINIHAMRKDGFSGGIKINLINSSGLKLTGGYIPENIDRISMTLTASGLSDHGSTEVLIGGQAIINKEQVSKVAKPADEIMQAFLFQHLVPAQKGMVQVLDQKMRVPAFKVLSNSPILLKSGDSKPIVIKTKKKPYLNATRLELKDPPKGIQISQMKLDNNGFSFLVKADKELKNKIYTNLIVKMIRYTIPNKENKKTKTLTYYLPAIPIQVQP